MNKICIICGNRMTANICECGFDRSRDYDSYRTVSFISDNLLSTFQNRKNYDDNKYQELKVQHINSMTLQGRAEAGDSEGQLEWAKECYSLWNIKDAIYWYKKSADSGNTEAMYQLGKLYSEGMGMIPDEKESIDWYKKASEAGNMYAAMALEELAGRNEIAKTWHLKEAEAGDPRAMSIVAKRYQYGKYGYEKDAEKALEWYERAIDEESGWERAQDLYRLADFYYSRGNQKNGNYDRAFAYFEISAAYGVVKALERIANMYQAGLGFDKNPKKAVQYYMRAAKKGSATAMYQLGKMYFDGKDVERNPNLAKEWLIKAAQKGDQTAINMLKYFFKYNV